jgi:hypothetical protein
LAKINIAAEDVLAQTEVSNEELEHLTNISNE